MALRDDELDRMSGEMAELRKAQFKQDVPEVRAKIADLEDQMKKRRDDVVKMGGKKVEKKVAKPKVQKEKKERKVMTVSQTKLGVTLVLHKDECKLLGFDGGASTREVINAVKKKLGLEEKKEAAAA